MAKHRRNPAHHNDADLALGRLRYLKTRDLAALAGVTVKHINRAIASGELRRVNVGLPGRTGRPTWRVELAEWQRYVQARSDEVAEAEASS